MILRREIVLSDIPAIGFALSAILGIAFALFVPLSPSLSLFLSLCLSVTAILALMFVQMRTIAVVLTYIAIGTIACFRGETFLSRDVRESLVRHDPDTAIVNCRGVVVWRDAGQSADRSDRLWLSNVKLILPDTIIQTDKLCVRLRVPLIESQTIRIGDVIACNVRLESAHIAQQRSVRELCWSLRERIVANAKLADRESQVVVFGSASAREVVYASRESLFGTLERYLKPDARAVASALLLGSREAFSNEFREDLQLTGLAHLFALSGLNTGLLVSLCWVIMAWLRTPRNVRYVLLLLFLAIYTALGLGVPSLIRSAAMAGMMIVSRMIARPSHPINLLLFALGLELMIWPLHVLDVGFILSYLSMAGILAAYGALHNPLQDLFKSRKANIVKRVSDTLSSTIGAQLATAPVVALLFGRVPALAIVANVIAIPLFSILVVLILFLLLFDQVSFVAASVIARSIEGLVSVFSLMISSASSVVGASVPAKTSVIWGVLAIVFQLTAIVLCLRSRFYLAIVFTLVTLNVLIWPGYFSKAPTARIVISGERNSEVIYLRAGEMSCVIGCGPEWLADRNTNQLADILHEDGKSAVDVLVIDSRNVTRIGGAASVISATNPEIVIDFSLQSATHASALLDGAILQNNIEHVRGKAGMTLSQGSSQMQITQFNEFDELQDWHVMLSHGKDVSIEVQSNAMHTKDSMNSTQLKIVDGSAIVSLAMNHGSAKELVYSNSAWRLERSMAEQLMSLWNLPGLSHA